MLEGLGIEPAEEQVYVALVGRPATNAQELADRTGLLEPEVEQALAELGLKGLVTSHPDQRRRLRASPPDINLSLMALQRMDDVRKAQLAIAQLAQSYRGDGAGSGTADSVEVIEGGEVIAERYAQVQRAARVEVRSLIASPVVAVPAAANPGQRDALHAGVRYRSVYERASLDLWNPDTLLLEEWVELGEEMRISVDIPLKIAIVDSSLAFVASREHLSGEPTALVVRNCALLEALGWIFDRVWESALPLPAALAARGGEGPLASDDRHLLSLLLAGYTDQAIATQQDVSLRTVQRRVQRLLALAGAQSRLQLGWQAARRNWI
ncbi:helix-turn-helix domain-containing protein [Streptomyces sp. NPDC001876]|uniref:helix-turn-helix domain-containing protein n=1 Tax=Streptomyces sp. NPDC001876 TaxID=3154402 RepID=UPI00331FEA18